MAFHQGLLCLLTQNSSTEKEKQYSLEIITRDPSVYIMDHSYFIVCSFMENSIGLKQGKDSRNILSVQAVNAPADMLA